MVRAATASEVSERATLAPRVRVDLLAVAVLAGAAILAGLVMLLMSRDVPGRDLSAAVYPARLSRHLSPPSDLQPSPAGWNQPSDIVAIGGRWFVLDTGNNRILELNDDGAIVQVMDQQRESGLALSGPMAIASDGRYLYVANSGAAQVLVLTPDGSLVRAFPVGNA